ncbi:MAG: cysteine desulfurase family protein [Marmoricola sp.]
MTAETYLDTASGSPLHPAAAEILQRATAAAFADPRRLHDDARRARLLLDNARASVAETLDVRSDEVIFVPSGTHACHLGLLGLINPTRPSAHVVVSSVEHSAVLHAAQWHERRGGVVTQLPVNAEGVADLTPLPADASVVALQSANHEVGTRQPVAALRAATDAAIFVDACASGGRDALPTEWDAMALSAHKWGGPAGVGILLVRRGTPWWNPFPGDDRADERAVGFENIPGALASAAALRAMTDDVAGQEHQRRLVARIRSEVAKIPDIDVVGASEDRLPHLVTFSCLYLDGESLVGELNQRGFAVASGSACTASSLEPSHVLAAMGALTHGNVRVSLEATTTDEEVDRFLTVLPQVVGKLRAEAGL